MHIFFSVGEPSGDQHAAQLMQELRWRQPGAKFSGFGGPQMQQAGLNCLFQLTDLAVMGIGGVLPLLGKFWSLERQGREFLQQHRPDAVVLIDYPGFNWWIAKAAKKAGLPVFYYCPPQLWAWGGWRISKVRKYVDCILSVLPFEAQWYQSQGIKVEYVGHPFFDEVASHRLNGDCCDRITEHDGPVVAILPGSRKQEVNLNFPAMLRTIRHVHQRHPTARFPVACYRQWHRERCQEIIAEEGCEDLPIDLYTGRTSEIIESATCAVMVSGSVSLELLARRTPAVVQYRGGWLMGSLARLLIQVKFMSLPNLMVNHSLMPEFPFMFGIERKAREIATIVNDWLSNPDKLATVRHEMDALAQQVAQPGGVNRAAAAILSELKIPERQRNAA